MFGTSYTLSGNPNKYCLPLPSTLKPYQDSKSGAIDTWPAHASAHQGSTGASLQLTKDKQLIVIDKATAGRSQIVPKPKFLDQLERFLEKELRCLGATEVKPSELRLQAYREVFEYLIQDFRTYKPLLSAIKNEYEMMLAHQRDEIRHLQPLQQMLVTVSEQSDQKLMAIRQQEKQEVKDLKLENQKLYERIDEMRNDQRALEEQVMKLSEELQSTYLMYRDECDARKLLISDINELRYQQEEAMMLKQVQGTTDAAKDDPVMLRIALKKIREDEAEATRRLMEMQANYGDVIPRRDFEQLQQRYQALEEKLETLKSDYMKLKNEHDALLDVHKQVVQQRDDYYIETETLKRTGTPRPNWNRCAEFVAGGEERWKTLSDGKTSDQMVDVLLGEIQGKTVSTDDEYFEGLGLGAEVPKYLQYEGKIKNRRLHRRDCTLLIHDIWQEKQLHDEQRAEGGREAMADFVHSYLEQRFSLPKMVAEWAYNLRDASAKYAASDDSISLFWAVLNGQGDEQLYYNHVATVTKLLDNLIKVDQARGDPGTLTREDFGAILADFFGTKDAESISMLVKAAEAELNIEEGTAINYKSLFAQDDGHSGPFLEELRKQTTHERLQYVSDIEARLSKDEPVVTVEELRQVLLATDPEMDSGHLDAILRWAFGIGNSETTDNAYTRPLDEVLTRLQFGNICRTGKKP